MCCNVIFSDAASLAAKACPGVVPKSETFARDETAGDTFRHERLPSAMVGFRGWAEVPVDARTAVDVETAFACLNQFSCDRYLQVWDQ